MYSNFARVCIAICISLFVYSSNSVQAQTFVREEIFNENFKVSWEPNFTDETVKFHLTVATAGFVGFGISPNGGMAGADIVIGGVNPDGTKYFQDYYAIGESPPVVDDSQDWYLIDAMENATHTELIFSRKFDTCDENDSVISDASSHFIWSFGATDKIEYHAANRGGSTVNILDPPMPDENLAQYDQWKITKNMTMPAVDTSYWCTIHKRPELNGVHHVVGFGPYIPSPEAVKHTHHIVVFECDIPEGGNDDEIFGPYLDHPGEECDFVNQSGVMGNCYRTLFIWATGGKEIMFPENVGLPINEVNDKRSKYVKMEFHYDNPQLLTDVTFDSGLTVYHTPTLRPIEAGQLLVDHRLWATHIIPPGSTNYVTAGHCSPECTKQSIPPTGINIFNVFMHSHLAGRKLRLRHFRNGVELPWIVNDENYNFNFQQSRPLRETVLVLPGDQLTYECRTDTTDRSTTTLSGLSTRHEMCESFSFYYPRIDFGACGSYYYKTEELFKEYGVDNVTWEYSHFDPTVTAPAEHAGKLWSQVLDEQEWTQAKRDELMNKLQNGEHQSYSCGSSFIVTYPEDLQEYVPPQTCSVATPNPTSSSDAATTESVPEPTTSSGAATTESVPEPTTSSDAATTGSVPEPTTSSDAATTGSVPEPSTSSDAATTESVPEPSTTSDAATTEAVPGNPSSSTEYNAATSQRALRIDMTGVVVAAFILIRYM